MNQPLIRQRLGLVLALLMLLLCGCRGAGDLPQQYSPYIEEPSAAAATYFQKNQSKFTDSDRIQAERTPAFVEFLVRKKHGKSDKKAAVGHNPFAGEKLPYHMQWDPRWAFDDYAGGHFGQTGCGPTVLSIVYAGLSGDLDMTPDKMGEFSQKNGYSVDGNGTSWLLMSEGANKLGLQVTELPLVKSKMIGALEAGRPIILILGPGDFTSGGHFIVLRGVQAGQFLIYDPFSLTNSKKTWSFETLQTQIRNIWAYSLS